MGNFQKLRVWQLAKSLAVSVYSLTKSNHISRDFGFRDQIQRSAVSIPSNIAEGDELDTNKQSVHYFFIAKGSTAELMTQIIIGQEIGYIDNKEADIMINDCKVISSMLMKLIQARGSKNN
jgi:four helix bundle protein